MTIQIKLASAENYTGTGAWCAPETLLDGPVTEKADIFSLGLIIWEMLMLKVPHTDSILDFSLSDSFDSSNVGYDENFGKLLKIEEVIEVRQILHVH